MREDPLAIFAYGSLVDPASAELTLGRRVPVPTPVSLRGWKRRWSIARDNHRFEKTFGLADGTLPDWILGLNIEPNPQSRQADPGQVDELAPNGALIEVSPAELELLDLREMRYRRVEVGGQIDREHSFSDVFAYTSRPENLRTSAPERSTVIIRRYAVTVETAFAGLGPGHLELYRATTPLPSVPIVEAELIHDRVPKGNPKAW